MSDSPVTLERPAPGVAWLELAVPPRNQLRPAVRAALRERLDELAADADLTALVLSGAGGVFSAGNDIGELAELPAEAVAAFALEWDELYAALRDFPAPTIAAVPGYALGGGFELMLSCDLRVLAEDARVGCTAARLGLVTSTYSLAREVGPARAKELFFTARHLTAAEALQLGLANRVVPAAQLRAETLRLAAEIAANPQLAVRAGKRLIEQVDGLDRGAHDVHHRTAFVELTASEQHGEAVRAFLDRPRRVAD